MTPRAGNEYATLSRRQKGGDAAQLASMDAKHHDASVRTTLTLDPSIAARAKRAAAKLQKPLKEIINSALRIGLDEILAPPTGKPYRTKARPMGLRHGFRCDDVHGLIAAAEGEDHS
jgi:hypothetical protein